MSASVDYGILAMIVRVMGGLPGSSFENWSIAMPGIEWRFLISCIDFGIILGDLLQ